MSHRKFRDCSVWRGAMGLCVLSLLRCGTERVEEQQEDGGTGGADAAPSDDGGGLPNTDAAIEATPDAESDAGDGGTTVALVAGSDFFTTTEVAAIDVSRGVVLGHVSVPSYDAIPVASGGRGFIVDRANDVVHWLSSSGSIEHSLSLGGDGGGSANPHAVVVVPGSQGPKAYVSLYEGNAIVVVNADTGAELSRIDLAAFLDAADMDGSVEVDGGFYDPVRNRLYFTLQRVDLTTVVDPLYQQACPTVPSLLIGIDPTTDTLADINGSAAGEAVELSLVGPADIVFDAPNDRALLLHNGCYETGADAGSLRVRHGIEAVSLATGATTVVYEPTSQDFLNRLLPFAPDEMGVESFDENYVAELRLFVPSTGSLGAPLPSVPEAPIAETSDTLLGVVFSSVDGGTAAEVVRYVVSTGTTTPVVSSPWSDAFEYVSGIALVKP